MATILVVDDEADIRLLTKLNLERDGHRIVTAGNGSEALTAVQAAPPDLILLDVMMPEVDGWAVLDQLKQHLGKPFSDIPVILLTALGGPLDRVKGGIEGAVRYLTKPIDLDELRDAVTNALATPEGPQRRQAQARALEMLARIERNVSPTASDNAPRPRLSGLERGPEAPRANQPTPGQQAAANLDQLTTKQRELLEAVWQSPTVMEAAASLQMSRSNVYSSLRRISRKLGTKSVRELLHLVRHGDLFG
ncbi:MAG TPA: response regulator [Acidimicrobiales bacterium]|jgi:CheY-like chemotaxis protein/DNA-binding CsgD family transcriptional regulator|nr:response regulator [Acidimicrobiales bacterium]